MYRIFSFPSYSSIHKNMTRLVDLLDNYQPSYDTLPDTLTDLRPYLSIFFRLLFAICVRPGNPEKTVRNLAMLSPNRFLKDFFLNLGLILKYRGRQKVLYRQTKEQLSLLSQLRRTFFSRMLLHITRIALFSVLSAALFVGISFFWK